MISVTDYVPRFWFDPQARSPYDNLCSAVLHDALHAWQRYKNWHLEPVQYRHKMQAEFDYANDYIFEDDWEYDFSFVNLCEHLKISASSIRKKLRASGLERIGTYRVQQSGIGTRRIEVRPLVSDTNKIGKARNQVWG